MRQGTDVFGSPALAMDADGDMVVTWIGAGGILARSFNRDGTARSASCQINKRTNAIQFVPDVAMDADGDYVVVWESKEPFVTPLYEFVYNVYFRRFTANSACVGVGSSTNSDIKAFENQGLLGPDEGAVLNASDPVVAMDADGDFVIAASFTYYQDLTYEGARVKFFRADGTSVPSYVERPDEKQDAGGCKVNSAATAVDQSRLPAVSVDADGEVFVVSFDYLRSEARSPIFFRRFTGTETVDLRLAATASPEPVKKNKALAYSLTLTNSHAALLQTGVPAIDQAIGSA